MTQTVDAKPCRCLVCKLDLLRVALRGGLDVGGLRLPVRVELRLLVHDDIVVCRNCLDKQGRE